jgi:pimeloyl-ACP methyl ester carboxylesterase
MMHPLRMVTLAMAFVTALWNSGAATMTQLPGLVREPLRLYVTLPDGTHAELEALLTRPDGPGRFPLVMINHGTARTAIDVVRLAPEAYSAPAVVFAQHAYAAVVVNRRGYGLSSSAPLEIDAGPCGSDYAKFGSLSSIDVLAALAALQSEPWAEPNHAILVGHSSGGFAVLAAAANLPAAVAGIISFTGAFGSPGDDVVCQPERLVGAMRKFGANVQIPSLWIYAENDHFFGPTLARQMFDAFTANGAPAAFDAAPPFGRDGHRLILAAAPAIWWPRVATFLEQQHMPTQLVVDLPQPPPLPDPPNLDARDKEDFASYVSSRSYEKAFATDDMGHYVRVFGERTQEDAKAAALAHCKGRGWTCQLYALNNMLSP